MEIFLQGKLAVDSCDYTGKTAPSQMFERALNKLRKIAQKSPAQLLHDRYCRVAFARNKLPLIRNKARETK